MPYNSDTWTTSEGEDRYRRSMYTFWRRTSPYPGFMTFDASSREFCTARRVRTNTPLQALTLLNDPASFEAARALATHMMTARLPAAPRARASAFGIMLVLSRDPAPGEVDRLVALYEGERAALPVTPGAKRPTSPARPRMVRHVAELAAWTIIANVLLNLDETVTKQ